MVLGADVLVRGTTDRINFNVVIFRNQGLSYGNILRLKEAAPSAMNSTRKGE